MTAGNFASIILTLLEKGGITIATDGLVNSTDGAPSRTECKLVLVGPKVVFGVTGTGRFRQPPFDPYRLAMEVGANQTIRTAAQEYGKKAAQMVRQIWKEIRTIYLRFSGLEDPLIRPISPHSYIFTGVDADGTVSAAGGNFVEEPRRNGVLTFQEFHYLAVTDDDVFLWRSGSYEATPDDAATSQLINRLGGPEALKQMIRMQIMATPRLVGEPIAVLVISSTGTVNWYSPGACSTK